MKKILITIIRKYFQITKEKNNNKDKNRIMIQEEQMNKYEVEPSFIENYISESEEITKDIKELEKAALYTLTSKKKIIEKEKKRRIQEKRNNR